MSARSGGKSTVVEGISAAGLRVIARLEADRYWPASTALALRLYEQRLRDPARRLWDDRFGCGVPECCSDPADLREQLEVVCSHLRGHDRRAFRARLGVVDDQW